MCRFLSAIVTKDSVYSDPEHTDSHEDLIAGFGLRDDPRHIVRVEFTPGTDIGNPDGYTLVTDQYQTPIWWDDERKAAVESDLRNRVTRMIVRDSRPMLLGGCWILVGECNIVRLHSARVVQMSGTSQVGKMYGASQVGEMYGTSQVGEMYGTSQVGKMYGASQVGEMYGTSQVGKMYGASQVGEMYDTSQVGEMYDTSQVGKMYGTSQVGEMYDTSQVGKMSGTSQVGKMCSCGLCKPVAPRNAGENHD